MPADSVVIVPAGSPSSGSGKAQDKQALANAAISPTAWQRRSDQAQEELRRLQAEIRNKVAERTPPEPAAGESIGKMPVPPPRTISLDELKQHRLALTSRALREIKAGRAKPEHFAALECLLQPGDGSQDLATAPY